MIGYLDLVIFCMLIATGFFSPLVRQAEEIVSARDGTSRASLARAKARRASVERSIKNVTAARRTAIGVIAASTSLPFVAPLLIS